MTVREQLRQTTRALEGVSSEARCEAEIILAHVYGIEKGALVMRFFDEAKHGDTAAGIVRQRLQGKPLAYILHSQNFYGRDFYVDDRVLIPRFDTEWVVEAAIATIRREGCRKVADVCCGSGCIGVTIALEAEVGSMLFADSSRSALEVARRNHNRLAPDREAEFHQGDLLEAVEARQDLIVVNPPYIARREIPFLESQVRDFEPREALDGGEDGLDFYRRLCADGPRKLTSGGVMICEVGDGQADDCARLFLDAGWRELKTGKDAGGMTRWIAARRD